MLETDKNLKGYIKARLDEETETMLIDLCDRHRPLNRSDITRMAIRRMFTAEVNQPEIRGFVADGKYTADLR